MLVLSAMRSIEQDRVLCNLILRSKAILIFATFPLVDQVLSVTDHLFNDLQLLIVVIKSGLLLDLILFELGDAPAPILFLEHVKHPFTVLILVNILPVGLIHT